MILLSVSSVGEPNPATKSCLVINNIIAKKYTELKRFDENNAFFDENSILQKNKPQNTNTIFSFKCSVHPVWHYSKVILGTAIILHYHVIFSIPFT